MTQAESSTSCMHRSIVQSIHPELQKIHINIKSDIQDAIPHLIKARGIPT